MEKAHSMIEMFLISMAQEKYVASCIVVFHGRVNN